MGSDYNPLHLIQAHFVAPPIVELRGAGAGVVGHGSGLGLQALSISVPDHVDLAADGLLFSVLASANAFENRWNGPQKNHQISTQAPRPDIQ